MDHISEKIEGHLGMPRAAHDRDLAQLRSKLDEISASMVQNSPNGHYSNGSGEGKNIYLTGDNEVSDRGKNSPF